MKKFLLACLLIPGFCVPGAAQKKNYVSAETGAFFGNANANLSKGMISSGLGDDHHYSFLGIISFTDEYPQKSIDNSSFRIRYGHFFKHTRALEIGFGRSYYGDVSGYDDKGFLPGNFIHFNTGIHTLYVAYMMTDSMRKWGFGLGPAANFLSLTRRINEETTGTKKNYVLPGVMITGHWNIISKRSWLLGLRMDLVLTSPASIDEVHIVNSGYPDSESTFRSAKVGSFNGHFGFVAGVRF